MKTTKEYISLISSHADELKKEVLADDIVLGSVDGYTKEWNINGENVTLGVKKQ